MINKLQVSSHQAALTIIPEFEELFQEYENCINLSVNSMNAIWPFKWYYKFCFHLAVSTSVRHTFDFVDKYPKYTYTEVNLTLHMIGESMQEEKNVNN